MREQRTKVTRSGVYWRGRELDKEEIERRRQAIHLREFPREVIDLLLSKDGVSLSQKGVLSVLERLWNGEGARPEPAHPNGSNCPNPNNEGLCGCKPVCPTCGGSRIIGCEHCIARNIVCPHTFTHRPCPDCTRPQSLEEAAQRSRASAERAGARCLKCGIARWESTSLCDHVYFDRRKGQQRKWEERREVVGRHWKDSSLVLIGHRRVKRVRGNRLLPLYVFDSREDARRKGDRRSTTSLHQQTLAEVPDEIRERVRKEGDQRKGQRRVQIYRRAQESIEYMGRLKRLGCSDRRAGEERRNG